jgi:hypothetical protein
VRKDVRGGLGATALLASLAGLLACPQILQDDFLSPGLGSDAGAGSCGGVCVSGSGGSGGSDGVGGAGSGVGGAAQGVGGDPGPSSGGSVSDGGDAGTAGTSGASGAAGAAGAAGASGLEGADASAPDDGLGPDCWVVAVNDPTQDAADNCLGIYGWNEVVTDTDATPLTSITRSYEGGSICMVGTIQPVGWGAVYNLTFADEAGWDAASRGVGGFRLAASGAALPPAIKVVYTASSDFCRVVTPSADTRIPFSSAHPNCTGTPGAGVPNASSLEYLRLALLPGTTAYPVDFCLQIRAIP